MSEELTGQLYGTVATGLQADIPDPEACQRSMEELMEVACAGENLRPRDRGIDKQDGRRVVWVNPENERGTLAYRVEFFYQNELIVSKPAYYITACNMDVFMSFNQIQNMTTSVDRVQPADDECETTEEPSEACHVHAYGEGGNRKTGHRVYNRPPLCLDVRKSGSSCTMLNDYVKVVDNMRSTSRSRTTAITFNCATGYSDPVNGAYGVASDAMYFGTIAGEFYIEKYSYRALPYVPRLVIHFGSCYDNAFWDGTDMYFGDGCRYFYPLVSQDVTAHELSHGITTRNSNLNYRDQSGGINEAFSDISGEVAELFGRGSNDWMVGYELFQGSRALRYFIDPTDDGRSIKSALHYRNGMGVHTSSGVFNHAFYRLVEIEGMDIYDAYECFLRANRYIWSQSANFYAGACGVMQAAYDNGYDHNKVFRAFAAVDISLLRCNYRALSTTLSSGEVREEVLVSATRKPIIAVRIDSDAPTVNIEALGEYGSDVTIEVANDGDATDVFATGTNIVEFSAPEPDTLMHVRLSSENTSDVKVMVTISA